MNRGIIRTAGIAALSATMLLTGCGKMNPDSTLVTINTGDGTKDTISLGYGNFAARYQQAMYDQYMLAYYGEGMWKSDAMTNTGETFEEETKSSVLDEMEGQYLCKLHAADYDIALTEEQTTAIADAAAQFIADNPAETIKEMGATEEYVKQYLEYRTYYSLVSDAAKEQADADITEDDCWMRTFSYVVFDTTGKQDESGAMVQYTDDEVAAMKDQADQLAAADDFAATVEELGVTSQNYSYLKGEEEDSDMDMVIIEAAEALAEGETSSVIEIDGVGYYVINLTSDHDTDASQTKRESLQSEAFNTLLDTWKGQIVWKVNDKAWKQVKYDALFKTPDETTEETTTEETTDTTATDETVDETTDTTAEEQTEDTSDETSEEVTDESAEEAEAE